jgi:hypothetical protein
MGSGRVVRGSLPEPPRRTGQPVGGGVVRWVAWRRTDLLNGYSYPRWLLGIGGLAWLLTFYLAINSVGPVIDLFR